MNFEEYYQFHIQSYETTHKYSLIFNKGFTTFNKSSRPLSNIHIKLDENNPKYDLSCTTLVIGLASDLDLEKIAEDIRIEFQIEVEVKTDSITKAEFLAIKGDFRKRIKGYLKEYNIWEQGIDPEIKVS